MNKTVIKNFAVDAHKLLVEQIKVKAYQYGVTDNSCPELNTESINGKLLSDMEKFQLNALIKAVNVHGYNYVIEEVAYTWFNRFIGDSKFGICDYLAAGRNQKAGCDNGFHFLSV